MKLRSLWKGILLVTLSAFLIFFITAAGCFAFGCYVSDWGRGWSAPVDQISATLTRGEKGYTFSGDDLLGDRWAMLLNEEGRVVWSQNKPEQLPEEYTLQDVVSFTRWYLEDYPVLCWTREDGVLVVGSPKGSVWKHDMNMEMSYLLKMPYWFLGIFLLALVGVLGLARAALGRWFRQEQQVRDAARSGWINGVSHDIRTPLSIVMGYAAQMEQSPALPPEEKHRASAIRTQSQMIRDLVNDLNLTMRLDCDMQALRKESLQPEVFLRQIAADFLNGGMGDGYDLEIDLPQTPLPRLLGDPFLLRRAVNNLLTNCVRHNPDGCTICLGAKEEKGRLVLWVEGGTVKKAQSPEPSQPMDQEGEPAHGTGLRLVAQIAAAHGGKAEFRAGPPYRCILRLPLAKK